MESCSRASLAFAACANAVAEIVEHLSGILTDRLIISTRSMQAPLPVRPTHLGGVDSKDSLLEQIRFKAGTGKQSWV